MLQFICVIVSSRPLDDDFSEVMSEPKRPVQASSISRRPAPNTSVTSKETSSRLPAATPQTPLGSGAHLFAGRLEDRVSHAAQEEPQGRKRKEMEAEIQMEELESIMSQDMDFFDEPPSGNQGQHAQPKCKSPTGQRQGFNMEEAPSSSKKQRVHAEDSEANRRPLENKSNRNQNKPSEQITVSIKKEKVDPSENTTTNHESIKSKKVQPVERDEPSFIEVRK